MKSLPDLLVNKFTLYLFKSYRKNKTTKVKQEKLKLLRTIEGIRKILPKAEEYQIPLAIENHWGISALPENILKIVSKLYSPYPGTCPDFGNFPNGIDRYEGLKMLASKAVHVHAKGINFDEHGKEKNIDYRRCLKIPKNCG